MKRKNLFNDGWEFCTVENGAVIADTEKAVYTPADIPHDSLIGDTNNLYRSGDILYRKFFELDDIYTHSYILYFDGVYMDSTVYVNGTEAVSWTYGYSSFGTDISSLLVEGKNRIDVIVRYKSPNSRWYSGAGIYRNVWLYELSPVHLNINGVYISADANTGDIYVNTEAVGVSSVMPPLEIINTAYDADGNIIAEGRSPMTWSCNEFTIHADNFKLWSLEERNLYTLKTELAVISDGTVLDSDENIFGFRKVEFKPDTGFWLNGKNFKLKGVCLHHDLGCLGSAVNHSALERQLLIMKKMGVNSVRTSHNMPAPELMEICDRIGLLVNSESFDMWELPKTEFDNARFFKDTAHRDVMSWVKRDRNHPSLIMWSIGNEIYDTHVNEHGYEIAEQLAGYVRECDYKGNAFLTIGSNFIEWENAQKVGKMLGVSGYNYTERCYDDHHKKYPETVIYGSETSSAVRSRGIYHFPADIPILTHDDHQCSSLANSTMRWGKPAELAWIEDRDRPFVAGQYIWSGIDYIGEPSPYDTKNSYFGAVDTAGIPKDIFYFYQSVWTDFSEKPMIHLLPYWDFNPGQEIDVIVYTNAPCTELFVNGESRGKQYIDHKNGKILHGSWKVKYVHGEITAKAYDENGNIAAEETRHSFGDPVKIVVNAEKSVIKADGRDVSFVIISAVDKDGYPVENARNRVTVTVSGAGRLMGMDNGDSTDYDQYKTNSRRLFSGKCAAAIMADTDAGEIKITVSSEGLESAETIITAESTEVPAGISANEFVPCPECENKEIPVRKIELICDKTELTAESPDVYADVKIFPGNHTYDDISCSVTKPNGVKSEAANAEYGGGKIHIIGKGDGDVVLTAYCKNGGKYPQVLSCLSFTCSGMGQAVRSPYAFISASTYDRSPNDLNIVENNALGGFSGETNIYYENIDFGRTGSDLLKLYVGNANNRDISIDILDGEKLLLTVTIPHNNLWNSFEPFDFTLPERLTGTHTVCVRLHENCVFGGFEFIRIDPVTDGMFPADADEIYGDEYTAGKTGITGIGNNTSITFKNLDFGDGVSAVKIMGRTPNDVNTIQMRITADGNTRTELLEFKGTEHGEQTFTFEKITGEADICFMFMPGSNFDFDEFVFVK